LRRILLASLAALALAGCHVVRYDTGQPASPRVVTIPVRYFFWGLKGDPTIDLDAACPEGAARWESRATFTNKLLDVVTLGIYVPRTVIIECAEGRTR
jgi:hypothetical protein